MKKEAVIYDQEMLERLKAFSDALLAIIATLLVLDIPFPEGSIQGLADLSETADSLIIFMVSFLMVMAFYFETLKAWEKAKRITGRGIFTYIIYLMLLSLLPFMSNAFYNHEDTFFMVIIFAVYTQLVRQAHLLMVKGILKLNNIQGFDIKKELPMWRGISYLFVGAAIALEYFKVPWGSVLLLYLPLRSLIGVLAS